MVNIMISILPDGMPVDKMQDDDEGNTCPLPTQDEDLNAENKMIAMDEYGYREPNTSTAFGMDQICGNCSSYNVTDEMLNCIGDTSGDFGYCQLLKFTCTKENVCDSWAEGGPITSDMQEDYKDYL